MHALCPSTSLPYEILSHMLRRLDFTVSNSPTDNADLVTELNLNIDVTLEDSATSHYDVCLHIQVSIKNEDADILHCNIEHSAIITLSATTENIKRQIFLAEVPRFIFPYVRQTISDISVKAGFTPILLDNIDFYETYRAQLDDELHDANWQLVPQEH